MLQIKNLSESKAELFVYGEIGWETDAYAIAREVSSLDVSELSVRIHSPGGDVYDGLAIMNALKAHPAHVTAVVEGLAASAASFIAVGGADRVVMRPGSELMIHDAMTIALGNAEDLGKALGDLDRVSNTLAEIYAAKAGTPADMWREAMRAETWFTADEAVEAGLADEVSSVDEPLPAVALARGRVMNVFSGRRGKPPRELLNHEVRGGDSGMADEVKNEEVIEPTEAVQPAESEAGEVSEAVEDQAAVTSEDGEASESESAESAGGEASDGEAEASEETVVTLDRARYEELLAQLAEGQEALKVVARREAEDFVDRAISEGRLGAASRDREVSNYLVDAGETRARIEALAVGRIPRSEKGHSVPDEGVSVTNKRPRGPIPRV
ncbi:head maturation protease, ClpP-related [Corynebacterium heidelbergense]|nr:head maturation protease, ClpP-related [Corynebacterium heidelbergense]WCZ36054.1 ATP-dependent Clp protease proteolytic subunit [Corynebacterium heidelbergense]